MTFFGAYPEYFYTIPTCSFSLQVLPFLSFSMHLFSPIYSKLNIFLTESFANAGKKRSYFLPRS